MTKVTKRKGPHPYVQYLMDHTWDYDKWQRSEGIPMVRGHSIEDVGKLTLEPWSRMGGKGTFINLADQKVDDAYVCEIPPGESLNPQRHLFEEIVYVCVPQARVYEPSCRCPPRTRPSAPSSRS